MSDHIDLPLLETEYYSVCTRLDEAHAEIDRLRDLGQQLCAAIGVPDAVEPIDWASDMRAELERMRPRVWLTGDTIPGGVVTIAGPDDTPLVWPSDTTADGDEVEVPIPDYHAAVARARRERTATEDTSGWELQATPNRPSHRPPAADMEAGAVYDIGAAFAIYWPYTHPCHPKRAQWVVLTPEGGVEVTHDRPRDRMVRIGRVDRAPDRQVRSLAWLLWTAARWQWSREGCATEAARWLHDLTPTPKPTQRKES